MPLGPFEGQMAALGPVLPAKWPLRAPKGGQGNPLKGKSVMCIGFYALGENKFHVT